MLEGDHLNPGQHGAIEYLACPRRLLRSGEAPPNGKQGPHVQKCMAVEC